MAWSGSRMAMAYAHETSIVEVRRSRSRRFVRPTVRLSTTVLAGALLVGCGADAAPTTTSIVSVPTAGLGESTTSPLPATEPPPADPSTAAATTTSPSAAPATPTTNVLVVDRDYIATSVVGHTMIERTENLLTLTNTTGHGIMLTGVTTPTN